MAYRVLIVEDDQNLRTFLHKAFREEGYLVDAVASGDDGLAAAMAGEQDCIVLDRSLPGQDGMAVLRELRSRGRRTPVLMLTARGEMAERVRGLEAGADDYLPKPFDLPELLARVQALIRRATLAADDLIIRVGQLTVDPTSRRVTVAGRTVDLTPREFSLLEYMARNRGRTLSRARIAEAVWNYQFDPETNVVDVYVNYVRRKLG
ncbi:MAG: response regulator transcription factor, partial [Gemmatimonadales bacterium]